MMTKRAKALRVPEEFEKFITNLSMDFSQQTGLPKNNSATMRRMANQLEGKLIVKGLDFDMAIFGKKKRVKL